MPTKKINSDENPKPKITELERKKVRPSDRDRAWT